MIFTLVGCSNSTTKITVDETEADTSEEENEPTNKLGTNLYNIAKGSPIAVQGDWVYRADGFNIYKSKIGKEEDTELSLTDYMARTEDNSLNHDVRIKNVKVLGEYAYFINEGDHSRNRVKIDTSSEVERICGYVYEKIFIIAEGHMYFTLTIKKDQNTSTQYVVDVELDDIEHYLKMIEGIITGLDDKGRIHFIKYDNSSKKYLNYSIGKKSREVKKESKEFIVPLEMDGIFIR